MSQPAPAIAPAFFPADSGEPAPINLHDHANLQAALGYSHGLTLGSDGVQEMARRIHGISAITGLLIAATDSETVDLGEWMRGGLLIAVDALARDAQFQIEQAHDRAAKAAKAKAH